MPRVFTLMDRFLGEIDRAINVLAAPAHSNREPPRMPGGELVLDEKDLRMSARLMRVNHSGEVAAQALYRGQVLTARQPHVAAAMRQACDEEMDHLAWCETRIAELNGRSSVLNPVWYVGSFAIGAFAGIFGDEVSLGFVVETEKQVEAHLRGHRDRLPAADVRSRAIVDQMGCDEAAHGAKAASLGANQLPAPLRSVMRLTSRLMTFSSFWV